jgi:hypothetical protein
VLARPFLRPARFRLIVSSSLESRHFYMVDDLVQRVDGVNGRVLESMALWAVISWEDGRQEELDQLDPAVWVVERGSPEG